MCVTINELNTGIEVYTSLPAVIITITMCLRITVTKKEIDEQRKINRV
jgi:hypothetical protein